MYVERSMPWALNSTQLAVVFRDLGRIINYDESPQREVAVAYLEGLICQGWNALPEWVRSAEVRSSNGKVISIDMVENVRFAEVEALFEYWTGQVASFVSYPVRRFPVRVFCT